MTAVRLGGRLIGPGEPCYLIAEAGVNHNGDIELAKQLVVEAKRAGADCVKFQTFRAARLVTAVAPKASYQLRTTDPAESQIDMLRRLELEPHQFAELKALATAEGIAFLSTPYSTEDVDTLASIEAEAYKIPSALLVEPHLLRHVARQGRPMFLSTGMATLDEVDEAVSVVRESGAPFVLLQCTTDYPSLVGDANLRAMKVLEQRYNVPVGYSDHTQSPSAILAAVALGAAVIEKHFTLDRTMSGPDHSSSADPRQLAEIVSAIREVEAALGNGEKGPTDRERANLTGMRRSLVARRAIAAGEMITEDAITCKRPATGIAPRRMADVLGRIAKIPIEFDQLLDWSMFD